MSNNAWEIIDGDFTTLVCEDCAAAFLLERGITDHKPGENYRNEEKNIYALEDVFGQYTGIYCEHAGEQFGDVVDAAPDYASKVAALARWATNYDFERGTPYWVFLDLIGYSSEQYGTNLMNGKDIPAVMGYLELDYLADALKQYANRPADCLDYINKLQAAD